MHLRWPEPLKQRICGSIHFEPLTKPCTTHNGSLSSDPLKPPWTPIFYPGQSHQGALSKLRYAIDHRRGAAILVSEAGLGKTLLLQTLQQYTSQIVDPFVHIVYPKMNATARLAYITIQLGADDDAAAAASIAQNVRAIEVLLQSNAENGNHTVLILDEAHLLDSCDGLEIVRLLLNFEHSSGPSLTLLLAGQPSLLPMLKHHRALEQRFAVQCLISAFDLEETRNYITHRLSIAGASRTIFEEDAIEAIHHVAAGIPREINRICDLALLIGFVEQLPSLRLNHIESIANEVTLMIPPQAA